MFGPVFWGEVREDFGNDGQTRKIEVIFITAQNDCRKDRKK